MSASLVQKSLELVDPDFGKKSKGKKKNQIFNLIHDNHKITRKVTRKGGRIEKHNLLSTSRKLTVAEAQKHIKSEKDILKSNLKKLKAIKEASRIELDESITQQIIERAVTKRPVKSKDKSSQKKKETNTVFTEADFKKFEAEYFDD